MKELHRKALIYSGLGMSAVIASAVITHLFAPQNALGQGLRFFVPLFAGIVAGAFVFFNLKKETDIDFDTDEENQ